MPSWFIRSLCAVFGHRFGAPGRNGAMICARCGILAYAVPVGSPR